eukprot:m.55588 g.55588  ORF g.55588 m.55588 type:complete len:80 (+) comp12957_c0_seq2:594-833(+)
MNKWMDRTDPTICTERTGQQQQVENEHKRFSGGEEQRFYANVRCVRVDVLIVLDGVVIVVLMCRAIDVLLLWCYDDGWW